MKCPKCGSTSLSCIDSRPINETIRRRRKCMKCGQRFSTYEIRTEDYYGLKIIETLLDDTLAFIEKIAEKRKELQK